MNFKSSPFVSSLRDTESDFLQVLLTKFSLRRSGRKGAVLSVYFDSDTEAIAARRARNDVRARIPDFEANAARLQKLLDDFLVEHEGHELDIDAPDFPFRYVSGGVLPVLHYGGEEYYCLFLRDEYPVGWNIANGGSDTRAELLNPNEVAYRELREELLIVDLRNRFRFVFADGTGKSSDRSEFSVAREVWREHFPKYDFPNFKEIETPIIWEDGPDELRIKMGEGPVRTVARCYVNVNALDFGIEVDHVVHLNLTEDATLCDGEIIEGRLLNRVIGLFGVDELNRRIVSGETSFKPQRVFHNAVERSPSQLEQIVAEYAAHVARDGLRPRPSRRHPERTPAEDGYGLCPVTRRIIKRFAGLQGAATGAGTAIKNPKVFVCFAEEDESLARQVSELVERMGIPVFFSRGHADPSFFEAVNDALESATCLVAVATRPEHLMKEWPRFEWSTFHLLMLSQRKRGGKMVSVVSGFAPERLPLPFLGFQSVRVDPRGVSAALEELAKFLRFCCARA